MDTNFKPAFELCQACSAPPSRSYATAAAACIPAAAFSARSLPSGETLKILSTTNLDAARPQGASSPSLARSPAHSRNLPLSLSLSVSVAENRAARLQLVHPLMKAAGGGSIVFNSSVAGVVAISSGAPYAASKARGAKAHISSDHSS